MASWANKILEFQDKTCHIGNPANTTPQAYLRNQHANRDAMYAVGQAEHISPV